MPTLVCDFVTRSGVLCMLGIDARICGEFFVSQIMALCMLWATFGLYLHAIVLRSFFLIVFLSLRSGARSGLRMLLCSAFLPFANATCTVCFGAGIGCKGNPADCPWAKDIVANVAVIAAASGGLLKVASLLPPRLLRVFTKPVLDTLSMIVARPKAGQPYDLTDKDPTQIQQAVVARYVSKSEALMEFSLRMADPSLEITDADNEKTTAVKNNHADII